MKRLIGIAIAVVIVVFLIVWAASLIKCEVLTKVHYAEFIKDFDDTEEIASALLDAVTEEIELFGIGEMIHSITLDEVYAIARELLSEERLAYVTVYPSKGKDVTNAS